MRKIMLARESFDGPHVWDNGRILRRIINRHRGDWQDGRDEVGGGNPICPRRAFLACLALHAPRSLALADFFSILLERLGGIIEMGQRVAKGTTH